MESLEIYQEMLLAHNEQPHHFYALQTHSHQAKGYNPLCGDEVTVFLQIENGTIQAISFIGQGCAICKASASLMTLRLEGKSVADAQKEAESILQWLTNDSSSTPNDLGELEALQGVRKFPMRVKCATLAWHTFLKACSSSISTCSCKKETGQCCSSTNNSHACGCHSHANGGCHSNVCEKEKDNHSHSCRCHSHPKDDCHKE